MTDTYDPNCVLKVDAGYVETILEESGQTVPDEAEISEICARLGERWVSSGFYDRVSEDIIETAEQSA